MVGTNVELEDLFLGYSLDELVYVADVGFRLHLFENQVGCLVGDELLEEEFVEGLVVDAFCMWQH